MESTRISRCPSNHSAADCLATVPRSTSSHLAGLTVPVEPFSSLDALSPRGAARRNSTRRPSRTLCDRGAAALQDIIASMQRKAEVSSAATFRFKSRFFHHDALITKIAFASSAETRRSLRLTHGCFFSALAELSSRRLNSMIHQLALVRGQEVLPHLRAATM